MSWKLSKGFKFSLANYLTKTNGKLQIVVITKVIETSNSWGLNCIWFVFVTPQIL